MDKDKLEYIIARLRLLRSLNIDELPFVNARHLPKRGTHYKDHLPKERTQEDDDRRYHGRSYDQ